jgi:hypothetical protein
MLFFMGAASHYNLFNEATTGGLIGWVLLTGAVIVLIELNALIGAQGTTKKPLDSISGTIWSGVILWIVLVIIIKATLS